MTLEWEQDGTDGGLRPEIADGPGGSKMHVRDAQGGDVFASVTFGPVNERNTWATWAKRREDAKAACARFAKFFDLEAAPAAPAALPRAVGDLLAVMLGDGGHRLAEVGVERACFEATAIFHGLCLRAAPAPGEPLVGKLAKHPCPWCGSPRLSIMEADACCPTCHGIGPTCPRCCPGNSENVTVTPLTAQQMNADVVHAAPRRDDLANDF